MGGGFWNTIARPESRPPHRTKDVPHRARQRRGRRTSDIGRRRTRTVCVDRERARAPRGFAAAANLPPPFPPMLSVTVEALALRRSSRNPVLSPDLDAEWKEFAAFNGSVLIDKGNNTNLRAPGLPKTHAAAFRAFLYEKAHGHHDELRLPRPCRAARAHADHRRRRVRPRLAPLRHVLPGHLLGARD